MGIFGGLATSAIVGSFVFLWRTNGDLAVLAERVSSNEDRITMVHESSGKRYTSDDAKRTRFACVPSGMRICGKLSHV